MSFFEELKRRNVIRVGIAYAIAAWIIMQVADLVLENIGAPEWVMQTIMLVLAIGLPLVLIFAWVFEMTPEGLKKERDVDRSQSITRVTGRKLDRVIIGVLTVAVAYLIVDKVVLQDRAARSAGTAGTRAPATQPQAVAEADASPSVAVLPFVNMSDDPGNEYFSDGLTETLLHMLAQLPDLRVAARTSSFAFKGQNKGVGEIAAVLGVAHILEGSVQKAGERVRVTAQLIRADDGFHVWSQNYDRTLEDIFAIQDEIAGDVARALGGSLLGSEPEAMHGVTTRSTAAYDLFLQGLKEQNTFSYSSLNQAEGLFKDALGRDPAFSEAKLALARNYFMKVGTGLLDAEAATAMIAPLLEQAREELPGEPLTRALELLLRAIPWSDTAVMGEERVALIGELRDLLPRISGDSWVRENVAASLRRFMDSPEEAIEVLRAGLMLDPLSDHLHAELGQAYIDLGRYGEARQAVERALEIAPANPNHYSELADIFSETGDFLAEIEWYIRATRVDPQDHELAAHVASKLYNLELAEEAKPWAARCQALAPQAGICRRTQLLAAATRGDQSAQLAQARSMLRDDVDLRWFAFPAALFNFSNTMTELGRAEEAYEFLSENFPILRTPDLRSGTFKENLVKQAAIELMVQFRPREEVLAALDSWVEDTEEMLQRPVDGWGNRMWIHLVRGELDEAAAIALEDDLSRPVSDNERWKSRYGNPLMKPLSEMPEVAARLRELEQEQAEWQRKVRAALLDPEWGAP
jgi:TolB-like protein/thioredoxin-like negative regulator of GroEL